MSRHGPHAQFATGENFAAVAGCPEATATAMDVLREGGNVVDAALAASAVLCVALPQAVSLGGDLFALVRLKGASPVAVNATGAAPAAATPAVFREKGLGFIPTAGPLSLQTPGLVAGWQILADNFASRPLARLLEPAMTFASRGVRVTARLAHFVAQAAPEYAAYPGFTDLFTQEGRWLKEGDLWVQPRLARTLAAIAQEGARGFYGGWIARDIAQTARDAGGLLEVSDFDAVRAQCAKPLSVRFRDFDIVTQPPVSQGVILLRALRILAATVAPRDAADTPGYWRRAIAALRIAFQERLTFLGDRPGMDALARTLIDDPIPDLDGSVPGAALANHGTETTILSVMDAAGDAVSIIQSVFADLGAGVVSRESGVLMNNRLSAFFLDEGHPNSLRPGKRTIHTLHNFMAMDQGGVRWAGGSPGGDLQPQVNLQLLARLIDLKQPPADAVSAPRWAVLPGTIPLDLSRHAFLFARIDPELPPPMQEALTALGMTLSVSADHNVGSAKLVGRNASGIGAWCDRRRDTVAAAA
ncbi:MAG TPA: gamma-glutamyltransferase [Pseudorhodoplanes sp.]|jgi:gamma-glutamyltranspeptidase/glutathione hydrolase|nr:gamma-glutamyltransferase [Pseudorhodoplanes sp.]